MEPGMNWATGAGSGSGAATTKNGRIDKRSVDLIIVIQKANESYWQTMK